MCTRGSGCTRAPEAAEGGGARCSRGPLSERAGVVGGPLLRGASSLPSPAPSPSGAGRAAPPLGVSRLLFWQSLSA